MDERQLCDILDQNINLCLDSARFSADVLDKEYFDGKIAAYRDVKKFLENTDQYIIKSYVRFS